MLNILGNSTVFTLSYLKKINKDDLENPKTRKNIVSQLFLYVENENIDQYVLQAIEDIDETIAYHRYLEFEKDKEGQLQNIAVLEEELKQLIILIETSAKEA